MGKIEIKRSSHPTRSKHKKTHLKMATSEKKLLKPTTNTIQVSSKRDVKFYIFLSKIFLKEFPDVELHALGEAISLSVRVAEQLERHGYVKITKIDTFTFDPEKDRQPAQPGRDGLRRGKRVKMVIRVAKTPEFDKLTEFFGGNRQQTPFLLSIYVRVCVCLLCMMREV
eukprot:TRINITY_DN2896_c0_g4_i7.p1 TRINITY_DN2896_c0_g4~~TRINITY_DN2896_c0_g4_i7.p1  ORF type:complete len:169 (-),score=59.98 TRINITY_DN2896_c0_g4_i7:208-714(-)